MPVTMVVRHVYVHARSEEALKRRIDTFISALRVCDGTIVAVERRSVRGQRLAIIMYEFPLEHRRHGPRAPAEAPPPESGCRLTSAASAHEKLTAS
jgi:hypothetical protein